MKNIRLKASTTITVLLAVSLITSVSLYATVQRPDRVERILFFPGAVDRELEGEPRLLPRRGDLEGSVAILVEELTYGPARVDRSRVTPRDARAQSVIVRDGTAYIDLSVRMLDEEQAVNLSLEEGIEAIKHTLEYNFRGLDRIIVTVGGEMLRGRPQTEL